MRLLLDTHAFLWFILNDPKLSPSASALIADPNNRITVSPASYWEIAIKIGLGKYTLGVPFETFMEQQITVNQFEVLHITVRHAAGVSALPPHHRDPFDRLLVAQALAEQIPIVSADAVLDAYSVTRLW
jgi:PIN domain nuclease of toxin-antitoxin system